MIEALPDGLATPLSARYTGGVDVSGGQWQRIALSRALFALEQGTSVLVLDEPTANLDVRAEAELFDRFIEITGGATTILISHRFSTVRRADRIVVLDAGAIVEQGTHDELVALGGRYAELFRLQAARFALDSDGAEPRMRRWLAFVRYLVGVSLRIDRRRTYVLIGLMLVTAVSVPLFALGTKAFVNAAAAGNATRAMGFGVLVGVLWIASVAIGHLVRPVAFELGDLNGLAFDAELIELGGGSAGLEHLENPEYANRLELARSDGGDLFLGMLFLASLAGLVLQLLVTMMLLAHRAARAPAAAAVRDPGDDRRPLGAGARRRREGADGRDRAQQPAPAAAADAARARRRRSASSASATSCAAASARPGTRRPRRSAAPSCARRARGRAASSSS